jgi:hypothetical protein
MPLRLPRRERSSGSVAHRSPIRGSICCTDVFASCGTNGSTKRCSYSGTQCSPDRLSIFCTYGCAFSVAHGFTKRCSYICT